MTIDFISNLRAKMAKAKMATKKDLKNMEKKDNKEDKKMMSGYKMKKKK
jgi:hypothetical protein